MTLLGLGLALAAGCFTNFEKVDTAAGGSGGSGASGGTGGVGGTSGVTGGGGSGGACASMPTDCEAATFIDPFLDSGEVRVTDAIRDGDKTLMVGTFTGVVTFKDQGQHMATGSADGFLYEIDDAGMGTRFFLFEEADVNSVLYVDQHQLDQDIIVAGTFHESCMGMSKGLFVRRLDESNGEDFRHCIDGAQTEQLNLTGARVGEGDWTILVGDFKGMLYNTTSEGVDGFALSINNMGVIDTDFFVVGGPGDASIRAVQENFVGNMQWLIAGDYSGELSMGVANVGPLMRNAGSDRHLFLATVDDAPSPDSNLELVTFGEPGANHRLVDLGLLAEIEGDLVVGNNTIQASGKAALALTFDASSGGDGLETFGGYETVVLRAKQLDVHGLQRRGTSFAIAGQAWGYIAIEGNGASWAPGIPNPSCVSDLFFLDVVDFATANWGDQRCGGGQTVATAMAPAVNDGFVTAVTVGNAADITLGGQVVTGRQTLLLTVPKPSD